MLQILQVPLGRKQRQRWREGRTFIVIMPILYDLAKLRLVLTDWQRALRSGCAGAIVSIHMPSRNSLRLLWALARATIADVPRPPPRVQTEIQIFCHQCNTQKLKLWVTSSIWSHRIMDSQNITGRESPLQVYLSNTTFLTFLKKNHKLNHRIQAPSSHHSSWHFLPAHESYFWLNVPASVNISQVHNAAHTLLSLYLIQI